jgi:hypothetical protein
MNLKDKMRGFAVRSFGEGPEIHDLLIPDEDGALLIRVSMRQGLPGKRTLS